tara:strand:+ start:347 stop:922 length:576 start_codon:yes stop_codon:yes gene_type:complete
LAKKILILSGSPRKEGNTKTVVNWVSEGAKDLGALVEIIDVAGLDFQSFGCRACMGCQSSDKFECIVEDEVSKILVDIPSYDILIFATPLYFFGPTAQLKAFTDRMYSLFKYNEQTKSFDHNLEHITLGLVSTGGGSDFSSLNQLFNIFAKFMGNNYESLLIPFIHSSEKLKNSESIRQKAIIFGQKLLSA